MLYAGTNFGQSKNVSVQNTTHTRVPELAWTEASSDMYVYVQKYITHTYTSVTHITDNITEEKPLLLLNFLSIQPHILLVQKWTLRLDNGLQIKLCNKTI